jgi:hypothetical protein
MTSFEEILMIYGSLLDSSVELLANNKIMKIDKIIYTECTFEENLKVITIIGDKSLDQDGYERKKIIIIKQKKDDDTYFNYECEYSGDFFMGKKSYIFKVYKNSSMSHYYSRY